MTLFEIHLQRDEQLRILSSSRLFRGLDQSLLVSLLPHTTVHRLSHGDQFWRRGVVAEHFHVVLRGVLELQRGATGPDTTLVALFGPGESPAIPVALERRPYVADAYAATSIVEILRVRAAPILQALPTDPKLGIAMNRALLDHCRLLHSKIDVLAAGTVPRRLAAFMLDLADRFGDEQEDGRTTVPLALSRTQIATYVGARVETVIRACSAWQKEGVLTTTRDGFEIASLDRLRAMLEGAVPDEDAAEAAAAGR